MLMKTQVELAKRERRERVERERESSDLGGGGEIGIPVQRGGRLRLVAIQERAELICACWPCVTMDSILLQQKQERFFLLSLFSLILFC